MYKPKDTYFYRARAEGYPARSVYKLEEIDKRHRLVKPGAKILELGASPGSWLRYCLQKIGRNGAIVAIDLEEPAFSLPPQVVFIKGDVLKIKVGEIKSKTSSFDLVLSDLAPHTTGIKEIDQARSIELALRAMELSKELLRENGAILVKVFESGEISSLKSELLSFFTRVKLERPQAIRKGSSEIYLLGLGFKKREEKGEYIWER